MKELEEVRGRISAIDKEIVELYEERLRLTEKEVQYRLETGGTLFGFIPTDKFDFQHAKVVFQGVEGAYSQQALQEFFGTDTKSYNVETWRDAMEAIANGEADYAVLPIENSSAGIVSENFDLLVEYDNCIIGEQIIKIDHCLLGVKGADITDITDVYSHPQALMQCSKFLSSHNDWEKHSMKNTAGSALRVQKDNRKNQAAIAAKINAELYNLEVLAEAIQNNTSNATKFIIVTGKKVFQKDAKKISLCFETPHKSGSLYQALSHLIYNNLNMTKIESRPIQGKNWEYRFFIDIDGSLMDGAVQNALQELQAETEGLKILGNY